MINLTRPDGTSPTTVAVLTPYPQSSSVQLPPSIFEKNPPISGLPLHHRGKVRDTYHLPNFNDVMLVVTTDRLSIFDVVLPALIPDKGAILNAINVWWRTEHLQHIPNDIVAFGPDINRYLPPELKGNQDLLRRATVVQRLDMIDAELIMRGNLIGSGYEAYRTSAPNHNVCGVALPTGLNKWSPIHPPIFTPSTKAKEGHDEHMTVDDFHSRFGDGPIDLAKDIFIYGRNVAEDSGIVLIDTKFEFGLYKDILTLGDECMTPDSSRFVEKSELEKALADPSYSPASLDKQPVRNWGEQALGFNAKTKLTPEVIERIHTSVIPPTVLEQTQERYHRLFQMLTGMCVREYNRSW